MSSYHLALDPVLRFEAGFGAARAAVRAEQFAEAERVVVDLSRQFPEEEERLRFMGGYALAGAGSFTRADRVLKLPPPGSVYHDRSRFLIAYTKASLNQPSAAREYLSGIGSGFGHEPTLRDLDTRLADSSQPAAKSPILSLFLSSVVPGAGQLYSGFAFDAIQDAGFNLILGGAAFSAWRGELRSTKGRNYVFPVLTTGAWALFYVTNLYNAVNAAQKANLYSARMRFERLHEVFWGVLGQPEFAASPPDSSAAQR